MAEIEVEAFGSEYSYEGGLIFDEGAEIVSEYDDGSIGDDGEVDGDDEVTYGHGFDAGFDGNGFDSDVDGNGIESIDGDGDTNGFGNGFDADSQDGDGDGDGFDAYDGNGFDADSQDGDGDGDGFDAYDGNGFDADSQDGDGDGDGGDDDVIDSNGDGSDGSDEAPTGRSPPSHLLNTYLTRGGCCKDSCLKKYGDFPRRRALTLSGLDKKTRKAVVYGMLAVIRNKCGSRNAFQYRLDWSSPVCKDAFCAVIGISYPTLQRWMKQVCSDSDVKPHPHGNCGRPPHHALSRFDKSMVVAFIKNYAELHALPDPGRLQGTIRDYVLESGKTLKSVYAEYCKAMETLSRSTPAQQQPCPYRLTSQLKRQYTLLNVPPASPTRPAAHPVKYVSFIRLWRRYCFHIKIQPSRSDLCDKCDQMLVTLRHSLSDEQRKTINVNYNQHLIKAKAFRDAYNTNIEEAEKEWGRKRQKERDQILGSMESRTKPTPFTSHAHLDMQMQYSFDYCQQVSLPYSSQQRGTFYFRTPRKVQVFGVCCEPLCRQVFFLIDEAEQAGKGAVVVVSLVHAFFHLHGLGERRVTLQADNCVGQNKNTTMMWYLAWRVITGQHEAIQLNFMLPGHTKFRPDSYFGLFKKYYRRQDHVDDMDDLADCVRQCGQNVTCVPQLFQDWQYYDWNAFLGQWFGPLVGFGRYYTFEFDQDHPGVMRMKTLPSDTNPTEVPMLRAGVTIKDIQEAYQSQVMPPVITPSGLSLMRSLYLYEKVREYVRDPKKRDKVCPKPTPGTAINSSKTPGNVPASDQPGPSNAIPDPPAVESADDTHSYMQDEGNSCVSGRRKRRSRSELILAFQCTVCGNKYGSSSALSLHKKNTHKQPAVPGDEHGDVTKADNASVDEGSQGPSKRRRRKKSEIDRQFSCLVCGNKYGSSSALYTHKKRDHGS